jgi:hypothetical protein
VNTGGAAPLSSMGTPTDVRDQAERTCMTIDQR